MNVKEIADNFVKQINFLFYLKKKGKNGETTFIILSS